jgi:hypothetical protein
LRPRHSGASRNPAREAQTQNWIPVFASSFRRKPESSARSANPKLETGFRLVIPAQAGNPAREAQIQIWIPAFAGMTTRIVIRSSWARQSGIQIASSGFACDGTPRGLLSSHRNIESSHVFNIDAAMQHTLQRYTLDSMRALKGGQSWQSSHLPVSAPL